MSKELSFTPATELARMIREKALSPLEVMRETIARAEALNPRLNAICTPTFDAALKAAAEAEDAVMRGRPLGILHGVPTTIKDLALTRGVRTMSGSHIHRDRIPDLDHLHVERLRAAGAISIGKTTVSEFGWSGVSNSPLTGITHNPWKHGMNAGASSAGAGVCAAAGIGPIHQGSDGAGSIRMPAGFCGVYGIKPSHGRVPYWPTPANGLISHVGALARTGVAVTGVDLSPSLIALARKRAAAGTTYIVGDARDVPELKSGSFDAATCIMAAMNIEPVEPLFAEIARLLRGPGPGNRAGGRAVIVILHPAFRVPRQSRWKWDDGRKLLVREVDRYLGALKVPIDLRPFNRPGEAMTATYHRPVETYLNGLAKAGLWTDALEEWPSHRTSQPGPRAKAENRARDEFPLFLAIRANKVSFRRWA